MLRQRKTIYCTAPTPTNLRSKDIGIMRFAVVALAAFAVQAALAHPVDMADGDSDSHVDEHGGQYETLGHHHHHDHHNHHFENDTTISTAASSSTPLSDPPTASPSTTAANGMSLSIYRWPLLLLQLGAC